MTAKRIHSLLLILFLLSSMLIFSLASVSAFDEVEYYSDSDNNTGLTEMYVSPGCTRYCPGE
jgi:hypothetical protein